MNHKLFNAELEKTIIGNLILDDELDHELIASEYFYYPELKTIYKQICKVKNEGKPTEHIFIELDEYIGVISNCTDVGVVTTNYAHNCKVLVELYASRQMYELGENIKSVKPSKIHQYSNRVKERIDEIEMIVGHKDLRVTSTKTVEIGSSNKKGYVSTGFDTIDYALNDLEPKRVTLIAGKTHHGKTTFVRSAIVNALNTDNKVLWVMGENEVSDEIRRLYQLVVGKYSNYFENVLDNKRIIKVPKKEIKDALDEWSKNLRILNKAEAKLKSHAELLSIIEKELKVNKHNLIIVDNLMSVLTISAIGKNDDQGDFMQTLCDLSKLYSCHIILVLHPRKDVNYDKPDNDFISGSGDLPNKADNVIFVTKGDEDDKSNNIDGYIHITKNKKWGTLLKMPVHFEKDTEGFAEIKDGNAILHKIDISKFIKKPLAVNQKYIVNEKEDLF